MKVLAAYQDEAYALLRIVVGFLFAFHGAQKILGLYSDFHPVFGSEIWFAGMIELLGGSLIMVGLFTRCAAFICSGEMAVAYFQGHWKFQIGANLFPPVNHGELAVMYCFVFLHIATRGGLKWCLDKKK